MGYEAEAHPGFCLSGEPGTTVLTRFARMSLCGGFDRGEEVIDASGLHCFGFCVTVSELVPVWRQKHIRVLLGGASACTVLCNFLILFSTV